MDLDRDGDLDLVGAAHGLASLVWWENTAGGTAWVRCGITTADLARSVCAADLDGDGDSDLVAAVDYDNAVRWYENDGTPRDGGWITHDIAFTTAWDVEVGDIDGDGDIDVVASSNGENQLTWWEQSNSEGPPAFMPHGLANDVTGIKGLALADVDGDGDLDLVSAVSGLNHVILWKNLGTSPVTWARETLPGIVTNVVGVQAADLDRDNDLDLFAVAETSGAVVWWENQGPESRTPWRFNQLATKLPGAQSISAADLDHNGMQDLVVAAGRPSNEIAWFSNQPYQYFAELSWAGSRLLVHQTLSPLLELYVQHSGRDSQPEIALSTLRMRFRHVGGKGLTESELAALAESWAVYEDDGSGVFEPTDKSLGSLVRGPVDQEGAANFAFPSEPVPIRIRFGESRNFFVVAKLADQGSELGEVQIEAFWDDLLRDEQSHEPLPIASSTDVNSLFVQAAAAAPDLVPASLTVPEQGQAGQAIELRWEIMNRGNAGVSGEWMDRVFLSHDRVLDTNDLLIAEESWQGFLESGAKYARAKAPLLPPVPGGDYFLILASDILLLLPNEWVILRVFRQDGVGWAAGPRTDGWAARHYLAEA